MIMSSSWFLRFIISCLRRMFWSHIKGTVVSMSIGMTAFDLEPSWRAWRMAEFVIDCSLLHSFLECMMISLPHSILGISDSLITLILCSIGTLLFLRKCDMDTSAKLPRLRISMKWSDQVSVSLKMMPKYLCFALIGIDSLWICG